MGRTLADRVAPVSTAGQLQLILIVKRVAGAGMLDVGGLTRRFNESMEVVDRDRGCLELEWCQRDGPACAVGVRVH